MKWVSFLWFVFYSFVFYGQISPKENTLFPADEFIVYTSFTDSLNGVLYQIGRHEPKDYTFGMNHLGKWQTIQKETDEDSYHDHVNAPIYLKIQQKEIESYYFLDGYYDVDFYRFKNLISEKLLFITARYHFYIFDLEKGTLSSKTIPGHNQYEGEDAISGLYDALTVFDNERFLLGNVQGFGVFCFDISNTSKPQELYQYNIKDPNEEPFYVFLYQNNKQLFDVIIAQNDASSESTNISNFYSKLKKVRYVVQDKAIDTNSKGKPIIQQKGTRLIYRAKKRFYSIDLRTGIISVQ
ncbi:MAG TPA: hypothetical protein VKY33_06075 [Flavobacterium sp.]|nr:hypothetical protein [Flavobacterium sp.]